MPPHFTYLDVTKTALTHLQNVLSFVVWWFSKSLLFDVMLKTVLDTRGYFKTNTKNCSLFLSIRSTKTKQTLLGPSKPYLVSNSTIFLRMDPKIVSSSTTLRLMFSSSALVLPWRDAKTTMTTTTTNPIALRTIQGFFIFVQLDCMCFGFGTFAWWYT